MLNLYERRAELARDRAIEAIVSNATQGLISETTAIRQLREKGLTDPEIWERLDAR